MDSRPTRAGRQTNLAMVSIILLQFANMARGLSPCACGTERAEKARSQPPRRKVSRRQEKSSMRVQNTTHERQEVTATCEKHGREVERLSKLPINAKRKQIMNRNKMKLEKNIRHRAPAARSGVLEGYELLAVCHSLLLLVA